MSDKFLKLVRSLGKSLRKPFDRLSFHGKFFLLWARTFKKSIIVFRKDGLGDVLCCLPLIDALIQKFPDKNIVLITNPSFVPLLRERLGRWGVWSIPPKLTPKIKSFSWYIDSILIPTGVDEYGTGKVGRDPNIHLIAAFMESLGLERSDSAVPRLSLAARSGPTPDAVIPRSRRVVMHTGRSWDVKEWPLEHWQELTEKLHQDNFEVINLCNTYNHYPNDERTLFHLENATNHLNKNLEETTELILSADLFIGIDSGLLHLAQCLGIKSLGLFGPTDPKLILHETGAKAVWKDLPCSFCHHRRPIAHWKKNCPNSIQCMTQLEPAVVYEAIIGMMLPETKIGQKLLAASS